VNRIKSGYCRSVYPQKGDSLLKSYSFEKPLISATKKGAVRREITGIEERPWAISWETWLGRKRGCWSILLSNMVW
jgi:hypothetical protein